MKSFPHRFPLAAAAFAAAVGFTPAINATPEPNDDAPLVAAQEVEARGQNASDIIGRDVRDRAGESLGKITDLLVDPVDGKIRFAIIGSGGLLGIGQDLHPVPFQALRVTGDDGDELALDVHRARWSDAPTIREDQFASLNSHPMGRSLFEHYGVEPDADLTQLSSRDRPLHLMQVAELSGKRVTSSGEKVGEVDDVIVHAESRRASVLLDADARYAGTGAKFIVGFDQLTPTADRDELTTSLTRAEFHEAAPVEDNWWSISTGYPYIWGAPYATASGAAFGGQPIDRGGAISALDTDQALEGRPSVAAVRGALRSSADLPESARLATIERHGDTLVITGTVESRSVQQSVGEAVRQAASGWTIDNQLTVASAAE